MRTRACSQVDAAQCMAGRLRACLQFGELKPPSACQEKPDSFGDGSSLVGNKGELVQGVELWFGKKAMKLVRGVMNDVSWNRAAWKWHIQDPASQRLTWNKSPKSVLVIKKIRDASLLQPFKALCVYLMEENNMIVYVEKKVLEDPAIVNDEHFGAVKKKFCTFREDYDDISNQIDFIICLGGDGTLLYASSLFQGSVPPVMAFHLGSLGFLTPFNFENFQSQVTQVIEGNAAIVLRSRLKVKVVKELREKKGPVLQNGIDENGVLAPGLDKDSPKHMVNYQVLNEVVIDRGPSSYLSNVDVYLDGHLITTVQGDGVIVSTPTGSTAYAAAAGASMIHPNVPAIMITPICPHSLSFRPIVVPAGVELKVGGDAPALPASRDPWGGAVWMLPFSAPSLHHLATAASGLSPWPQSARRLPLGPERGPEPGRRSEPWLPGPPGPRACRPFLPARTSRASFPGASLLLFLDHAVTRSSEHGLGFL
ncbi:NAD kinase isoform X2 [Monodelphis domestica]|uniref:NAD kinase isoform X2 n=1 Tax=Monodelphis domestica TaxID=13616 RepID=UPI0024E1EC65|nr:NAD kinase isoform X2 [Monodelphis domestica]